MAGTAAKQEYRVVNRNDEYFPYEIRFDYVRFVDKFATKEEADAECEQLNLGTKKDKR